MGPNFHFSKSFYFCSYNEDLFHEKHPIVRHSLKQEVKIGVIFNEKETEQIYAFQVISHLNLINNINIRVSELNFRSMYFTN